MDDICLCECHENSNIRHIMQCCQTCPTCEQRIMFLKFQEHQTECQSKKWNKQFLRFYEKRLT